MRLVKHCLRILGRKFDKYLIPFLELAIKAYDVRFIYFIIITVQQNPIPGFIYSVEFCLVEYHTIPDY